jgi:hypothetical protein
MFSMITNIYNKKTKGPTLIELFTATGKLKTFFWQSEMIDVCTTGDMAHIDTLFNMGVAIFLLHTLASPSSRNVNYNEKTTFWENNFLVVPSICTGFVNACPTVFLS